MSLGSQSNYKQLLERHKRIRVPMIQRDYAQGRPSETEVREAFLEALKDALEKPADDASLPLNLDFIYGSVEGDECTRRFLPLDGQQRLTTLFLLHWYLAWRDDRWIDFTQLFLENDHSRFAYSVRPSSNEFFDQLVVYRPDVSPENILNVAALITDQPWYFRRWRFDPSIQAVLCMLNAIHGKFKESNGLFARLLDQEHPAITFHLLDLKNFGLSDDLYIKMNARGKPLTEFETFKARYEQVLTGQLKGETFSIGGQTFDVADYVARRIDTAWADLFWRCCGRGNLYDDAFMNLFRVVALITRSPESPQYLQDFVKLRTSYKLPSYADFHSCNWLDEQFTRTLVRLLDSWCGNDGILCQLPHDNPYLDEVGFFGKIVNNGANLTYTELVQFTAYVQFIIEHQGNMDPGVFQEWMRIIRNLAVNTGYNRPADFQRSVRGLTGLLERSADIVTHFAQAEKPATGFSELQIAEEKLKAQLILADDGWRNHIDRAESHGYFCGQIGFLLDFAGIVSKSGESEPNDWGTAEHVALQTDLALHIELAKAMFSQDGLKDCTAHLWKRALLCLGDYLLPSGRNRSFLMNSVAEEASWKRLLSGSGQQAATARNILKSLFSRLSSTEDIPKQLEVIIQEAEDLDPWRRAIINCPAAFDYCERNSFRVNEQGTIYLLKRSQMNGAHAELFTFCLYEELRLEATKGCLAPLNLMQYYAAIDTSVEPGILFQWSGHKEGSFKLEGSKDGFVLYCSVDPDKDLPFFVNSLVARAGFTPTGHRLVRKCSHADIRGVIDKFRNTLVELTVESKNA